jgi:hypothetical protein
MTILPIDEINALRERLKPYFGDDGKVKTESDVKDVAHGIEDELLDIFLLSYAFGATATNAELGTTEMPAAEAVSAAVDAVIAGETWRERVEGYCESGGTLYDIMRIAETDATRIYNQGAVDAVVANGLQDSTSKRWCTMMDDRVRDTHDYLEGMVIPFNERFYTYDNDSAEFPGGFTLPENNVNCRCVVEIIRG